MNLIQRMTSPTPDFFKKLRAIGLALGSIAAVVATAPLPLPAVIAQVAGYLAVAGGVATAVSQVAVKNDT